MKLAECTRRQMLKTSAAAAAAFTIVPRHVLGQGCTPPSDNLTRGIIGLGGQGMAQIGYNDARILGLAEVDSDRLGRDHGRFSDASRYGDWREVIARDDIDFVHIATPPHWHALMAIAAAEAGKDVFCEKPMTRTIGEGLKVIEACRKNGTILRVNTGGRFGGTYRSSGIPIHDLRKIVAGEVLGTPIKVLISDPNGAQWKLGEWSGRTNNTPESVPNQLDYNMWLGPAPFKPYYRHRTHMSFRGYWDYDGGGLGDMGMHFLDPVQYFLGKDDTSPVEIIPDTQDQHPDAVLPWNRITLRYADDTEIILDERASGPLIEGPEGEINMGYQTNVPNLRDIVNDLPDPEPQNSDFIDCIKTRKKFGLNEETGHRSCSLVNLAKLAVRLGRTLHYDPDKQEFPGDEQANRLIWQPMRAPWTLNDAGV